ADEKAMKLDMEGFEAELERQRERARQSWKGDEGGVHPIFQKFVQAGGTQFLGYQAVHSSSRVAAIIKDGAEVPSIEGHGSKAEIVLNETPFYSESGGQVGDTGILTSTGTAVRVVDTYSPLRGVIVHKIEVDFGKITVGDEVDARVDEERRR